MLIVSQNKEKVLWFGRAFNALEYSEQVDHKGKKETVRHTICISDGCLEEIAEYQTKERCLQVLKDSAEHMKMNVIRLSSSTLRPRQQDRQYTRRTSCMSSRRSNVKEGDDGTQDHNHEISDDVSGDDKKAVR